MAEIESVYRALPYGLTQFGEPRGMEFGLYTPLTRSANELIDALDAFVRLTTASVALAAYASLSWAFRSGEAPPRACRRCLRALNGVPPGAWRSRSLRPDRFKSG